MSRIILDCDLMKYPNTGLYYYCLNLGMHVNKILAERGKKKIKFYVPPKEAYTFRDPAHTIVHRNIHRFIKPFLWNCKVWHAPFQSGHIPHLDPFIKVVLTIHDLNVLHEGKPLDEQQRSLAHTQSLIDRSDAIICISEFTKGDVLRYCDVKDKPIYVIHNGSNPVKDPALSPQSYKPTRPFLFGLGYVNRKKNYHVLLSLLENTEHELLIAGHLDDLDYASNMEEEAKRMGVLDRLRILGTITEGEKAWYYKNCSAFVHPSLAEGFGMPVVEAMSCGKPLFVSTHTSIPEVASDVAFYFKNFQPEHMKEVYAKGMEIYNGNGLAKKLVKRSALFNWHEAAAKYINVYESLC